MVPSAHRRDGRRRSRAATLLAAAAIVLLLGAIVPSIDISVVATVAASSPPGTNRASFLPIPTAKRVVVVVRRFHGSTETIARNSVPHGRGDYLETLGADDNTKNAGNYNANNNDIGIELSLRRRRGRAREERRLSQGRAMYEASIRTYPREAIENRIEEGRRRRERRERRRLERFYGVKKGRLDAENRERRRDEEERLRAREGETADAGREVAGDAAAAAVEEERVGDSSNGTTTPRRRRLASRNVRRRGVPVLDRPYANVPPLLIGSTLTISYPNLTPFQRRAIDAARELHEEHRERMNGVESDDRDGAASPDDEASGNEAEGSVQAAPIVAVVDRYTAAATRTATAPPTPSSRRPKTPKRYATLASVQITETKSGKPSTVVLLGVGRAFLRDHFSSTGALSREEEELSELLLRIQEFDRREFCEDEDEDDGGCIVELNDDDDYDELPAVMAEFDLALDSSSSATTPSDDELYGDRGTKHRASSMHAVSELYRVANRVYRLHEERRGLVAGLRAGEARLRLGREKEAQQRRDDDDENYCPVEFEDCDGLGALFGGDAFGGLDGPAGNVGPQREEEDGASARRSSSGDAPPRGRSRRLETLENYGMGSYGALSAVPQLARQLMVRLEPYYSPAHREREEYEAEAASFAALRSLEAYVSPKEVAEALVVLDSATRRLEWAYGIMMRHRDELAEAADRIGRELAECGEECTDLW